MSDVYSVQPEKPKLSLSDAARRLIASGQKEKVFSSGHKLTIVPHSVGNIAALTTKEGKLHSYVVIGHKTRLARVKDNPWFPGWALGLKSVRTNPLPEGQFNAHDVFADYLDDYSDPRADLIRNRMKPTAALRQARYWAGRWNASPPIPPMPVHHSFEDGTRLIVFPYTPRPSSPGNSYSVPLPDEPPGSTTGMHVVWRGPSMQYYHHAMTKKQLHAWVQRFPEHLRESLVYTLNKDPRTAFDNNPQRLARSGYGYCPECKAPFLWKHKKSGEVRCPNGHTAYHKQVKLARKQITDNPHFPGWANALTEASTEKLPEGEHNVHDIFADYLDERGDPRADLVRGRMGAMQASSRLHGIMGDRFLSAVDLRPRGHLFLDGTHLSALRHHNDYVDPKKQAYHVMWQGPSYQFYHGAMSTEEFAQWINRFPEEERKALWNTYGEGDYLPTPKQKLARSRSPAGGAIINQQFIQGGQFMPRALKRIRRVLGLARIQSTETPMNIRDVLAGAGVDPGQKALTIDQLHQIEADHGIAQKDRLSRHVKVRDDGTIHSVPQERFVHFLETLGGKRLKGHEIQQALKNPRLHDETKTVYLVNHMAQEAIGQHGADQWYGHDVDAFERGLHHIMTGGAQSHPVWGTIDHTTNRVVGDKPGMTLAKALVALTSGNQTPIDNAQVAVRMLKAGGGSFLHIPEYNEKAFAAWISRAKKKHNLSDLSDLMNVGSTPAEAGRWYAKYVLPHPELKNPGYKTITGLMVNAPGTPDHGRLVLIDKEKAHENDEGNKSRTKAQLVDSDSGRLLQQYRGKAGRKTRLVQVDLPLSSTLQNQLNDKTGGSSQLHPKGWTLRSQQVVAGLGKLKTLLRHMDMRAAQKWLLTDHDDAEFKQVMGDVPDRGYVTDEKLPGAFIFGPKYGPFTLNLHTNEDPKHGKYLTADKWWSRTWNRFLNTFFSGSRSPKPDAKITRSAKHKESPRGDAERRNMWEAARQAAKKAGLSGVAALQAMLWYSEQHLWQLFGVEGTSSSFKDGINAALKTHARETGTHVHQVETKDGNPHWTTQENPRDLASDEVPW